MKKLFLRQITLTNFRGHKDLAVAPSEFVVISGENATGKSTIFDAFIWLLFGKDQFDRDDFEILRTENGQQLEKVDAEVNAIIDVDGRRVELTRTLHQKWVRKRGTSIEVFDGCETIYQWDGVSIKASEYKARVNMLIENTVFKMITNPSAFLALHWMKQREILFQIAGSVSDAEALDKMANLSNKEAIANLTNILNQGKSLVEFKKELAAKKKKLKDELETIQPRIDQTTRLMPETRDFAAIEKEISEVEEKIRAIELELSDKSAAIRGQFEAVQEKQKQINALKTKQTEAINTATATAKQDAFKANQKRTDLENEVSALLQKIKAAGELRDTANSGLTTLRTKKEAKEKEREQLRADWETENAKEYKAQDGCLICPVFGHECTDPIASEKHATEQGQAKLSFLTAKDKKLDQINEDGVKLTEDIDFLETRIKDGETYLAESTSKVTKLNAEHELAKADLDNTPIATPKPVIVSELPEWVALESQIKAILDTITTSEPVDNSEADNRKNGHVVKRDELKKQLGDRETIVKYKREIEDLNTQASEYAQEIANLEKQEFAIDAFNKVKIEECDRRVNGMFELVKFKLFDKTNEGNEFECCIPTNKAGVPIAVTNTAERINAGLDIINVLSRFYNVSAPIFCDGSESVNDYLPTQSQMIFLKVTKEPTLTVTNY